MTLPYLASLVDILLYVLVAITVALIAYKSIDLYGPRFLGKPPFEDRPFHSASAINQSVTELESGLALLSAIATAAPFIGLAGTVMHIMEALRGMGSGVADIAVISGPITTALNATLVGLASAIPAVIAVSLFTRRIQVLENAYRYALEDQQ